MTTRGPLAERRQKLSLLPPYQPERSVIPGRKQDGQHQREKNRPPQQHTVLRHPTLKISCPRCIPPSPSFTLRYEEDTA